MQLPDELNSKRQDPEDEYKTKMYQSNNRKMSKPDINEIFCLNISHEEKFGIEAQETVIFCELFFH
jgi:hypothetical protein